MARTNFTGRRSSSIVTAKRFQGRATSSVTTRSHMNAKTEHEYQRSQMECKPDGAKKNEELQDEEMLKPEEEIVDPAAECESCVDGDIEEAATTDAAIVPETVPEEVIAPETAGAPASPPIVEAVPASVPVVTDPEPATSPVPPVTNNVPIDDEEDKTAAMRRGSNAYGAAAVPPVEIAKVPPSPAADPQPLAVPDFTCGGVDCAPRDVVYSSGNPGAREVTLPEPVQSVVYPKNPDEKGSRPGIGPYVS